MLKTTLRRILYSVIICVCANALALLWCIPFEKAHVAVWVVVGVALAAAYIYILCRPVNSSSPNERLRCIEKGCELLILFLVTTLITAIAQVVAAVHYCRIIFPWDGDKSGGVLALWIGGIVLAIIVEALVFWAGMLRIYTRSAQLGIKHRVLALIFVWIPVLNIYYLLKMISIVKAEYKLETEKILIDNARADKKICKTKYPILLVHGVFFRDNNYMNYWGRIPAALTQNGATVYYGGQQSAASVNDCGKELAERIRKIVQETACEKVNIIAHSKGGLDSRAAITHFGCAPYVATLTTISTPHNGCIFADYLLTNVPDNVKETISSTYNATLKRLGDSAPDFMRAVTDLTASACAVNNSVTPDNPAVRYQSIMSYCKKARSGRFPMNVCYPMVKHFDGKNDGLVCVDSAKWGEKFTLIEPVGKRGISHGDMIDLNRENIPGFDVREFYVKLVADLKDEGF